MNNGNAHQSKWSQDFHAGRGSNSLPCPTEGTVNAGHTGTCKEAHPRGVVVDAANRWYAVAPIDPDAIPAIIEHYV